ncbi:MAG: hypothetical protein KAI24_10130, partial [Planctomycetes bacterium]|nr:hypothetical protein [Planctomycetota bacterium]
MSTVRALLSLLLAWPAFVGCGREVAPVPTVGPAPEAASGATLPPPPARLADTGLYADFARREVAADVLPYSPVYALWSDGANKRRWLWLPPGTHIDGSDPDAWRFPIGTRLW